MASFIFYITLPYQNTFLLSSFNILTWNYLYRQFDYTCSLNVSNPKPKPPFLGYFSAQQPTSVSVFSPLTGSWQATREKWDVCFSRHHSGTANRPRGFIHIPEPKAFTPNGHLLFHPRSHIRVWLLNKQEELDSWNFKNDTQKNKRRSDTAHPKKVSFQRRRACWEFAQQNERGRAFILWHER